jgi:hypothetical protein
LCVNHRSKILIGSKHLILSLQKIYPCEAREIINKDYIITMTPFRNEGSKAPYIRVNEIKRSTGHSLTSQIWELYLLAKSTTHTREGDITSNLPKKTTSNKRG